MVYLTCQVPSLLTLQGGTDSHSVMTQPSVSFRVTAPTSLPASAVRVGCRVDTGIALVSSVVQALLLYAVKVYSCPASSPVARVDAPVTFSEHCPPDGEVCL